MGQAGLRISLLGPLQVTDNGSEIDSGGAKQQLVLAALAIANNSVVSTDRLIDLVWGDNPPAKPNVTLRSYISHLRRVLDPAREANDRGNLLVTRSPGYALELSDDQLDVLIFETHVAKAREALGSNDLDHAMHQADQALGLWRSEQLDVLEDVFPVETAHLLGLRREVQGIGYRARLDAGRHEEALPSLQSHAAASPADEEVCRLLMLALYRSGHASEAVDHASAFRTHLLEDLGLEPTNALNELELQILNNDPQLVGPAPVGAVASATLEPEALTGAPAGRSDAFAQLVGAVRSATDEVTAPMVAVVGEPGIGKTTLLNATARQATQDGQRTLWGRCHDGGQTNTLWPWVSILRELTDRLNDDELTEAVGHRAAELGALIPEIADRTGVEAKHGQDALSLFDAIARTIRSLADTRPLVLMLEDAHWADVASIKLLEVALPIWASGPIATVVSWRDTQEVDRDLEQALAGLGRLEGFQRIELTGLDGEALRDLHRDLRGDDVSLEAIQPVLERTQGNPLFATELLRHGLDQPLSTTLRDAIFERLSQLPEIGADILVFGALCRDGFTTAVLEAASDKADDEVLDIVERSLAARLIEAHPNSFDRFQFTHALVQDALITTTSAPRRARIHAQLGDFYEARGETPELLAHHFLQGFNTGQLGADYALKAARTSTDLHDHASAGELLRSGIETLDRITPRGDGSNDFERLRVDLLIALGQTYKHSHNFSGTHSVVPEAFEIASAKGLIEEMAVAAFVYAGTTQITGRFPGAPGWLGYWCPSGPAIDMFTQCLERMDADHPYRAFMTTELGGVLFGEHADPERRRSLLADGIEQTRRLSDPALRAHTLDRVIFEIDREYSSEQRAQLANEAIQAAQAAGLAKPEVNARRSLAMQALEAGDAEAFHDQASHISQLAASAEEDGLAIEANLLPTSWALLTGDFASAERLLQESFDSFARFGEAVLDLFGIQFALLLRERGMNDPVVQALREKVAGYPGPAYATPLALAVAQSGDLGEAQQLVAPYDPEVIASGGEGVLQFMTPWHYAELLRHLGDVEAARVCREHLSDAADRIVAMNCGQLVFGFGSLPLGALSTMLGEFDVAERYLATSLNQHVALGARPAILRTHLALMELAGQQDQHERALSHHAEAIAIADELAALHWEIELATARTPSVLEALSEG